VGCLNYSFYYHQALVNPLHRTQSPAETAITVQRRAPSVSTQPSLDGVHEDGLLSRFLEFFSRRARSSSWTFKLPLLKNAPDAHALRSSLRAVSLAYFAHVTQNRSIQVESLLHYGQSLARQRSALARLPNFQQQLIPQTTPLNETDVKSALNALLAAIILSYFELISPRDLSPYMPSPAWTQHTLAAERLLVLLGPRSLSNDVIGQLFFSIRSHAVHRAVVFGQYTVFSERKWLEAAARHVSKQSYARSYFDRATELILRMTRLKIMGKNAMDLDFTRIQPEENEEDDEQDHEDTPACLLAELKSRHRAFLARCRKTTEDEAPLFVPIGCTHPTAVAIKQYTPLSSKAHPGPVPIDPNVYISPPEDQKRDIMTEIDPTPINCSTIGSLTEGPANLSDSHPVLQKQFAGTTTAYFHAAALLLFEYFPELEQIKQSSRSDEVSSTGTSTAIPSSRSADDEPEPTGPQQTQTSKPDTRGKLDMMYNARNILAAGSYLSPTGKSNGTAVLRMMLPFSIIWKFCRKYEGDHIIPGGPNDNPYCRLMCEAREVRLVARRSFTEWCHREGMGGLVDIAFGEHTWSDPEE
jgi:hypothetical protein